MKNLAEVWNLLSTELEARNTNPKVVEALRHMFYAGATALLDLQIGLSEAEVPEELAVAAMDEWHAECQAYADWVELGMAQCKGGTQ